MSVPPLKPLYSPLIEHAIELAAQWHDGTYRKSCWRDAAFHRPDRKPRVPVMAHVTAVATTVMRAGWDEATVAAAYLHDTLEDENRHGQRLRAAQLRDAVGPDVLDIVTYVTEQKLDDEGQFRRWRDRKEDYVHQIEEGRPEAAAISLADKLHNMWSMNQSLERGTDIFVSGPDRTGLSAGPEAQRWFHRAVLKATRRYTDARLEPMRDRLAREIERFEQLAVRSESPSS